MKTINYFKLKSATKESYKTHKETVENNIQLLLIIKNLATSDQTNMLFSTVLKSFILDVYYSLG